MSSWDECARLVQSESRRFQQYLSELPDDAWSKQSACDLWRVNDVVAHLVGNAEFYAATVERGLKGEYEPPEGRPAAGTGHPSLGAAGTAEGAIANRERLGGKLLSALEALLPSRRHRPGGQLRGPAFQGTCLARMGHTLCPGA